MKKNLSTRSFTEDDVRAYAFHLYQQGGCLPDRDLDNWLEAKACLAANIAPHQAHTRLHQHLKNGNRGKSDGQSELSSAAAPAQMHV